MMTNEEYFDRITPLIESVARHLCKKQNVASNGVYAFEDLTGDLMIRALEKRDKLEARLEAGEEAYVFAVLRNDGRDALTPERSRQFKESPRDDVGEQLQPSRGYGGDENGAADLRGKPRILNNPSVELRTSGPATPSKILRRAANASGRAIERAQLGRLTTVFLATLEGHDREIFRLHAQGFNAQAIALDTGLGASTVYRRLGDIKQRLRGQPVAEMEAAFHQTCEPPCWCPKWAPPC